MGTLVLIGGAWLGGWAWRDVAGRLRREGHDVYPATLTGLGERVHLGRPETDLETHVADVLNLVESEDLDGFVLVGHSYAGIVVTGVADRIGERLGSLVYVDTAPLPDGMAMLDLFPPPAAAAIRRQVAEAGDGWRLPFPSFEELAEDASLTGLDDDARALMRAKATPQPFRTYEQPLRLDHEPAGGDYERVLVACEEFKGMLAAGVPELQRLTPPAWRIEELATGHWPMLSAPAELAGVLAGAAAGGTRNGRHDRRGGS